MKLGLQKAPHFAHKQNKSCSIDIEPESAYHLEGKRQLYVWLKTQRASPILEPYIRTINQRPDVMARIKEHMLAVEYQCANIAPDVFQKRTEGFKQEGIIPQWIMGYSRLKRTASSFYQLSAFHWQFINASPYRELICYCPERRSFLRLSHIIPFYTNHSYSSVQTIPIHRAGAGDLFSLNRNPQFNIQAGRKRFTVFAINPIGLTLRKQIALGRCFMRSGRHLFLFCRLKCLFLLEKGQFLRVRFLCGRGFFICL